MARRLPPVLACFACLAAIAACGELKTADVPSDDPGVPSDPTTATDAATPADGDAGVDATREDDDGGATAHVCTEAKCPLQVVQQGLYGPVDVAVNAMHVYWIEVGSTIPNGSGFGQLVRIPKDGKCQERSCFDVIDYTVISGELEGQYIYGTRLALGLHDICYTQSYNANPQHGISCFDLVTPTQRALDNDVGFVPDLWVGATDAAWVVASSSATTSDGKLVGRPLTSGTAAPKVETRLRPYSLTSDGAKLFWTELGASGDDGSIQVLAPGGTPTPIATDRPTPVAIAIHGAYLYWIEQSARRIMRMRADGTGAPEQVATTAETPFALAVDDGGVYWASVGPGTNALYGSVAHAPLAPGGKVTTMIANIDKVAALATDLTSVYVASTGTNLDAGKIVRIAKTY